MYPRILFTISSFFYSFNFRGSTRVLRVVLALLPFKRLTVKHPLGFLWFLDSKESLSTYLSSCEKFTTKVVSDLAKNLNFVVCVGANRGWYPLLVSELRPRIEIHAYEPNSLTYSMLQRNVDLNHASVALHKIGIGSSMRVTDIFGYPDANDGMATLYPTNQFASKYERLEQIEIRSLDSEALNWNMPVGLSLLQMDIEGSEYEALQGGRKFLEDHSPVVICEVNPVLLESAGRLPSELFEYMERLGYMIYWIDERGGMYSQFAKDPCRHLPFLPTGSGSNYIFIKDFHFSKISLKLRD
jgi:FkbM family methyltransferase